MTLKVCFISEARSYHTQRWSGSLAKAGCDVHLISSSAHAVPGVTLHQAPIYARNPIAQMRNNARVRSLMREIGPDVYHLFGLFSLSSLGAMLLARGLRPLAVSVWGSDVVPGEDADGPKGWFIKRYLLNRPGRLVALSEYLAREVRPYLVAPRPIDVVPWGVDVGFFSADLGQRTGERIVLGFAKKLYALYGPDVLLKALRHAIDRCSRPLLLRIAGNGPMEDELKRLAATLGLSGEVEWVGWLDGPEALRRFYRSLDIFVMPSRRESFGVSAAEAAACGVPVIASRYGGIPEIVEHGVTGLLVEPDDVAGFGDAIASLAGDEGLRREMGMRGRKKVAAQYEWSGCVRRMVRIYEELAGASV